MREQWPPADHWAIRTRRRQVLVTATLVLVCVAATAWSWSDRSDGLARVSSIVSPIGAVLLAVALVATLRRR